MTTYSKENPPKSVQRNISMPADVDDLINFIVSKTGLEISYVYTVLVCIGTGQKPIARQYRYIEIDIDVINPLIREYKSINK